MPLRPLIFLLALLVAACHPSPPPFRGTDITGADFGRKLALTDHNGKPRTLEDFHGRVVVLFFGYTSCPDVCPTTLTRLAEVMKRLASRAAQVQVLFVSLDPERDTAERLRDFVPWFDPSFLGLYGDPAQTAATAREFRIFSARKEVGGGMGYVLDHSAGAYAFDPAGRLRLYFRDSATAEEIAADLSRLIDQS